MNKDNKQGSVKSTKLNSLWNRIGKKVSAGVVGLGLLVGTVFGFVGCTNNPTPTPTPNPPTPPPIVVVEDMKFDEFMSEHFNIAQDFVEDYIRSEVVGEKEVKSESWTIGSTDNTKIDKVSILYTYDVDKTERAVELANVTLTDPVSINKIVDNEISQSDIKMTVDRQTVFEFNAKENFDNQAITNALYKANEFSSSLKLISEAETTDKSSVVYNYITVNGNNIKVYQTEIEKGNGTSEAIIKNLNNGLYSAPAELANYSMNGTNLKTTAYTYENIEAEKPGPGPEIPPEVTVTDAEILKVLNEKVTFAAVESLGWEDAATHVNGATWYITKDGDNVTGANLLVNYEYDNFNQILLCKVDFASPLTPQNIKDGNVGTPTYTSIYSKGINTSIQTEHAELTDTICDKVFGATEGATRYIIENARTATDPKLGDAITFTVIEVTNSNIKEQVVVVAEANTDAELIQNLGDESKYYVDSEIKTYNITGSKVEAKEEAATAAKASKTSVKSYFGEDEIDFDDDLIM